MYFFHFSQNITLICLLLLKFDKDVTSSSPVSSTVFPKGSSVTGCDSSLGGGWMVFNFWFLSQFCFLSIGIHYTFSMSFTRLRIGHTLFSHQHLLEGRPIQYCEDYIEPLTVKHVLTECPSYYDTVVLFMGHQNWIKPCELNSHKEPLTLIT